MAVRRPDAGRRREAGRRRCGGATAAAVAAAMLFCPALACADPVGAPPPPDLAQTLAKAMAFELVSSTAETALFLAFYGSAAASAPVVFAVSLATSMSVYVAHEVLWNEGTGGRAAAGDPTVIAGKSATYRVASVLRSFAVGNLLGGAQLATSTAFAVSVAVADTVLYAGNEVLFSRLGDRWRLPALPVAAASPVRGSGP